MSGRLSCQTPSLRLGAGARAVLRVRRRCCLCELFFAVEFALNSCVFDRWSRFVDIAMGEKPVHVGLASMPGEGTYRVADTGGVGYAVSAFFCQVISVFCERRVESMRLQPLASQGYI